MQETSWTSHLLSQELTLRGELTSLQQDYMHSALYFSMIYFLSLLSSAPGVPHTPANFLSLAAGGDSTWLSICPLQGFPRASKNPHALGFS